MNIYLIFPIKSGKSSRESSIPFPKLGRESERERERVWKSRVRSRDANALDGSFLPLRTSDAAHFCPMRPPPPPSRRTILSRAWNRTPAHIHRRWYAERLEAKRRGGGRWCIRAWKTFLADDYSSLDHRPTRHFPPPPLPNSLTLSLSFSITII